LFELWLATIFDLVTLVEHHPFELLELEEGDELTHLLGETNDDVTVLFLAGVDSTDFEWPFVLMLIVTGV
jgi:hypothetical protein